MLKKTTRRITTRITSFITSHGILLMLAGIFAVSAQAFTLSGLFSKYKEVEPTTGTIAIDINTINDGKAHYFTYNGDNREIRFFVIKSSDGVIRAAFDACDVCFESKKGYSQEGQYMVCNNCGRKFHSNRINVIKGGCNPAPLQRAEQGGNLVIRVKDVMQGTRFF